MPVTLEQIRSRCSRPCWPPRTAASTSTTVSTSGASARRWSPTSAAAASSRAPAPSPSSSCAPTCSIARGPTAARFREAWLSHRLEEKFGKHAILQAYLNHVYFGEGYYGVQAASLGYFGKPASDITAVEGATLQR